MVATIVDLRKKDIKSPCPLKGYLEINIQHLNNAGVTEIKGFRAPIFSLTEKTKWAFDVLTDLGFSYSSSVLPAKSPLYGWPEFGSTPKRINESLIEMIENIRKVVKDSPPEELHTLVVDFFRMDDFFVAAFNL